MPGSRFTILSRGLRRKRGDMNRTETAWAAHLDALKLTGEVADWWYEPFTLRLSHPEAGRAATFTPDFLVLMSDGTTCVDDVKSGGMDDKAAGVRIKCAAELYPLWRFRKVVPIAKKNGGGWEVTEV